MNLAENVAQSGKIADSHYSGLDQGTVVNNQVVYLDSGPRNYRVQVLGAFLQVAI